MGQATRNQILLAALVCLSILSALALYLASKNVIPDSAQTLVFVVLGDMATGIVLAKLLAEEKAELDIAPLEKWDGDVGFKLTVTRQNLHWPDVECDGIPYELLDERDPDRPVPIEPGKPMFVGIPYFFYPFRRETLITTDQDVFAGRAEVKVRILKIEKNGEREISNLAVVISPGQTGTFEDESHGGVVTTSINFHSQELNEVKTFTMRANISSLLVERSRTFGPLSTQGGELVFTEVKPASFWKRVWGRSRR
jgi:hypothetical protein